MSKKKRPTDDELKELLFSGYEDQSQDLPAADPVMPTPMALSIDEIQPYELNPRRAKNEAWDEILHSLRTSGYRGRFPVTRRPGEQHYIPAEGGNTTLQAMKQLAAEGDERFQRIPVEFIPWEGESATLVAHLVENDARADLIFIDKARALRDAREQLEKELGKTLSHRELARELEARGYKIDRPTISRLEYALERLEPALPEAFAAGAGEPLVRTLRQYERIAERMAQYHLRDAFDAAELQAVFHESLMAHDAPEPDTSAIRETLTARLGEWLDIDADAAQLEFESLLRDPKADLDSIHQPAPAAFQDSPQAAGVGGGSPAASTAPGDMGDGTPITPDQDAPGDGSAITPPVDSGVGTANTLDAPAESGSGGTATSSNDAPVAPSVPAARPVTAQDLERPGALPFDPDSLTLDELGEEERLELHQVLTEAMRARTRHFAELGESPFLNPHTERQDRLNLTELLRDSMGGMRIWIDLPPFRMGCGDKAPGAGWGHESWIWWQIASGTLQFHLLNFFAAEQFKREIDNDWYGEEALRRRPRLVEDYLNATNFRLSQERPEPPPMDRMQMEQVIERASRIVLLRPYLYQSLDVAVPVLADNGELAARFAHWQALLGPVWRIILRPHVLAVSRHYDEDIKLLAAQGG